MMERWQHKEVQVKESRWAEEISQRWKQPKGEDKSKLKKEVKLLRCTHLAQRFSVKYREEVHEKVQKESVIFSFACLFGVLLALRRLDSEE